jgi:hypothetical protein
MFLLQRERPLSRRPLHGEPSLDGKAGEKPGGRFSAWETGFLLCARSLSKGSSDQGE